jgi:hypothetical protein
MRWWAFTSSEQAPFVTCNAPFDKGGFARIGPCPADGTRVFHGVSRQFR